VTLVDRWLGRLVDALRDTGRLDDTLLVVLSDHGHNLGREGDEGLVSKQGHPMTRAVADLVLLVRRPDGADAGAVSDALLANHDVVATMLELAGVELPGERDGISVPPGAAGRDYVTIGWGPLVTVITDEWWFNASIWGEGPLLYDLRADTGLDEDLAGARPDVCAELLELAVADAGGEIPAAFVEYHNRPGCTPFEDITEHWQSGVLGPARR
jgi:arylsulfatase A-like enzyme